MQTITESDQNFVLNNIDNKMITEITVSVFNNGTALPYVFTVLFFSLIAALSGIFIKNLQKNYH